ncbi:MAG TPA: hypothetical protein VFJ69_15030 [Actinomycetota bacterium]|nr:hypothetical protein [Actinomycetota bacterium]
MAKRTTHVPTADRAAADQAITATTLCDAHRHQLCPGRIISASPAHGQPCRCTCHGRPEAERQREVA